jgi:anti-sigma B factor antagonist
MTIEKNRNNGNLTIALTGRLDTSTSPQLEAALKEDLDGVTTLLMDFKNLEYISSAGLQVLLSAQKVMNKQGTMTVRNVGQDIMDIFDVTGFSEILSIE